MSSLFKKMKSDSGFQGMNRMGNDFGGNLMGNGGMQGGISGMMNMNTNMNMGGQMQQTDLSMFITSQPSNTIIVCDIPMNCTERDLQGIMGKYGVVSNIQKTPDNRNALVEFADLNISTQLVTMGRSNPFFVGSNKTRLEFCSQRIGNTIVPSQNMPNQVHAQNVPVPTPEIVPSAEPGVTPILHIEISSAQYPITTEVLNTICSPNGKVLRICIGKKTAENTVEALVEFENVTDAKNAKENLNGADIYSGCCTLNISFSKLNRVHVVKNDSESWDYTNPNPGKEGLLGSQPGQTKTLLSENSKLLDNTQMNQMPMQNQMTPAMMNNGAMNMGQGMNMNPPMNNMGMNNMNMNPPNQMGMSNMGMGPPNQMGMNNMGMGMPNQMGMNNMGMGMPNQMGMNNMGMGGSNSMGMNMNPGMGGMGMGGMNQPNDYFTMRPPPGTGMSPAMLAQKQSLDKQQHSMGNKKRVPINTAQLFKTGDGVVLMVYNLSDRINCDALFNIFCLYGNVAKVKFLKSRQGCAMIQMGEKESCELILKYFDGITLFGKQIQVCRSKQTEVQDMPNPGSLDDGTPLMKNYMEDQNNRFRNPGLTFQKRIAEPSRTLHFFNAPLNFSVADLRSLYDKEGLRKPLKACVFPSNKPGAKTTLGLAEWDSIEETLEMLALTNHSEIHVTTAAHPFHLKFAFSTRNIIDEKVGPDGVAFSDFRYDSGHQSGAGQKRKLEQ